MKNTTGQYEEALEDFKAALDIYKDLGDDENSLICLQNIAVYHDWSENYDEASGYYRQIIDLSGELGDSLTLAQAYRSLGILQNNQGLFDKATNNYLAALRIYDKLNDRQGMARCYNDLGIVEYDMQNLAEAINYFQQSLEIKQELQDFKGVSNTYLNIGTIYKMQFAYDKSIEYTQKALKVFREVNDSVGISAAYTNIGIAYVEQNQFKKAAEYYRKAMAIDRQLNDRYSVAIMNNNLANLHAFMADSLYADPIHSGIRKRHLDSALMYSNRSYEMAIEMGNIVLENNNAKTLMDVHKKLGNYKKTLDYVEVYMMTRDSLFSKEKTEAITEMQTRYETEKKQQQIELQQTQLEARDAKIKQQGILRNALLGGLAAVVVIVLLVIYAYIQKRRDNHKIREKNIAITAANRQLEQLNEEITSQKEEIERQRDLVISQHKDITDSINYAERIQSAILPPESYVNELLHENFILYKPRDIVSGDFYWVKQVKEYIIVVAADCTGHGVPGAFMSMLGISFLNEIVQRREVTQANQVLEELRKQVKDSLRQHGQAEESRDGMDMSICAINRKDNSMQFAGAFNSLYIIREKDGEPELLEVKADRQPVGFHPGKDKPFTNHEIQLETGDSYYMYSDGYIDQIGGKDSKKFMRKNFTKLLLEINDRSMFEQKSILDKTITQWMQDHTQIDDILVMGWRV